MLSAGAQLAAATDESGPSGRTRRQQASVCLCWTTVLGLVQLGDCSDSLPTAWRTGIATNYGGKQDNMDPYSASFGTKDGSCGYGELDKSKFPFWSVAALSTSSLYYQQGPVNGCGECFEIQCIDEEQGKCNSDPWARTITVMVTDACPACEPDHIDLQALTFNKMAPMEKGRVKIQYRRVQCTPPTGITIVVDRNAGAGGTLRLTVQQTGNMGSVELVQVTGRNSGWQNMRNTWGAVWEIPQQPQPPLDLRVQDSNGAEVTAFGIIGSNGQMGLLPTGVQFGFGDSTAGAVIQPGTGSTTASSSELAVVTAFSGPPGSNASSSPPPPLSNSPQTSPPPPVWHGPPPPAWQGPPLPVWHGPPPTPWSSQSSLPPPPPKSSASWISPPPPLQQNAGSGSSPPPPLGESLSPPPPPPGSQYSSGGCVDVPPNVNGAGSCAQQKMWGQCSQGWMTQSSSSALNGFCAKTCGRC